MELQEYYQLEKFENKKNSISSLNTEVVTQENWRYKQVVNFVVNFVVSL